MTENPADEKHTPEVSFEDRVAEALAEHYDVETQVYQARPYWYVDIVAKGPLANYYVELENDGDADTVRHGMMQATGYAAAADDPRAIPTLVIPADHAEEPDWTILADAWDGLALRFDENEQTFY